MNSCFDYIGNVKITVQKQTYKYKNSGTPALFEYMIRWLSGESSYTPEFIKPNYITITCDTPDTLISNDKIKVSVSTRTTTNGYVSEVIGAITPQVLGIIPSNGNCYLHLYNDANKELAYISITRAVLNQVKAGRQALIEWTLSVGNKEVITNE